MRILLVDDDPALRTLLKTTFEVADVDVIEADGAESARRRIRAGIGMNREEKIRAFPVGDRRPLLQRNELVGAARQYHVRARRL